MAAPRAKNIMPTSLISTLTLESGALIELIVASSADQRPGVNKLWLCQPTGLRVGLASGLQLGGLESSSRSPSRRHLCPALLGEPHPDILSSRDALCSPQSWGRVRAWHHI